MIFKLTIILVTVVLLGGCNKVIDTYELRTFEVNTIDIQYITYVNNIISGSYVTDVSGYGEVFTNDDFKLSFYTFNGTGSVEDVQSFSLGDDDLVEVGSYEGQIIYSIDIRNPLRRKVYQENYVSLIEQSNKVVLPYEEYTEIMKYEEYIAAIPLIFVEDERGRMIMLFHNGIFRF